MKQSYLLNAFMEIPWAILPNKLVVLEEIMIRHVNGEKLDPEEIQMRIHGAKKPEAQLLGQVKKSGSIQNVAILPLFGTIVPRANLMTDVSGATSAEGFGRKFAQLVNEPEIDAIILDVDSPGGQVGGIEELSQQIYDARGSKPIIAVANHTMASAAYWIGTAADEVVVTPSGEAGSIGVFAAHQDISQALESEGVKMTLISAGKYKVEGNPYQPLTEEAQQAIQASVNEYYDAFVSSVARNRGVSMETVRNGFGEGRVVGARSAVELGMADRVATLEETINRLFQGEALPAGQGAMQDELSPAAKLVILPSEDRSRQVAGHTSQDLAPVDESSNQEQPRSQAGEVETQAQRLRDEISQFLQGVTHGTESSL